MDEDDMDLYLEMPGGDDFEDVADLFDAAADQMASGELVFTDGFTLLDSMSAFEIGEPRMDSGMVTEQDQKPAFHPMTPLLPQEVCWILDRSFACEMEWHAGNTLSQTVYTLLYVHHLAGMDPDLMHFPQNDQTQRVHEGLITVVLRPAVIGLLKCCDLSWREMSKGKVLEDDWQGEKCEVSLLEGTPAEYAIYMLDEACIWLDASLPPEEVSALKDRILLRKNLLELLKLSLPNQGHQLKSLIASTRKILRRIRESPEIPEPSQDSQARAAFDPYITRRLHSFIPIRIVELPPQKKTWDAIETLLDGFEALSALSFSQSVFAWNTHGATKANAGILYPPFIRSLMMTTFENNNIILGRYPMIWIVERFFAETLGISYQAVTHTMRVHWNHPTKFSTNEIEKHVVPIVINHVRSHWLNPPRRRRHLMRSIVRWQVIEDGLRSLTSQLAIDDDKTQSIIDAVLAVPVVWQMSVARDIIFSGFQQQLYMGEERPIAYWYAVQIIDVHLSSLETLRKTMPEDTLALAEAEYQTAYLTGLRNLCSAVSEIIYKPTPRSVERTAINFRRRYKWLYTKIFPSDKEEQIVPVPPLEDFFPSITQLQSDHTAEISLNAAKVYLKVALEKDVNAPTAHVDRAQHVEDLIDICDRLCNANVEDLRWDISIHPWFPIPPETPSSTAS